MKRNVQETFMKKEAPLKIPFSMPFADHEHIPEQVAVDPGVVRA